MERKLFYNGLLFSSLELPNPDKTHINMDLEVLDILKVGYQISHLAEYFTASYMHWYKLLQADN